MLKVPGYIVLLALFCFACSKSDEDAKLFTEQSSEKTGVNFENKVVQDGENNVLNYPYYFNGGGVAVGRHYLLQ